MTVLATDDFNRTAGTLGVNWTTISAAHNPLITASAQSVVKSSGTFSPSAIIAGAVFNAVTWPNDQYSQIALVTLGSGATQGIGAVVRCDPAARNFYYAELAEKLALDTATLRLRRISLGVTADIATATLVSVTVGALLRVAAQGTTIRAFVNGVVALTATDVTIISGQAGIILIAAQTTIPRLDDWEGGDFSVTGAAFVIKTRLLLGVGR